MSGDSSIGRGLVVALRANYFEVEVDTINQKNKKYFSISESHSMRLLCTRRSRLDHNSSFVNVGDRVVLEAIDWEHSRAVIRDIEVRKSWLKKPAVANVTDLFVVLSLSKPSISLEQASRFLLSAEQSDVNVSLILNKSDLVDSNCLTKQLTRFRNWGYQAIPVSVKTSYGLDTLSKHLKSNSLSVLCGPSGVGKSSLIDYFLPQAKLRVGSLSPRFNRGCHTTRNVELYTISPGSFVVDTPGFNRAELTISPFDLQFLFPELRVQLNTYPCRFRNCLHRGEPGCGVDISWDRYSNYIKYLEEIINCHCSSQGD